MNLDPANHEANLKKAERIAYLIAGHLNGTLSNEEGDELDNWITASDQNLELFENLTDEDNLEIAMAQHQDAERRKGQAFEKLLKRLRQ